MAKKILVIAVLVIMVLTMTGCLPGDSRYDDRPAGFLWGVWHGWTAPISLIIQLFKPLVRVYEVNNTGWWYDFGFYISLLGGFGGLALTRRKRD